MLKILNKTLLIEGTIQNKYKYKEPFEKKNQLQADKTAQAHTPKEHPPTKTRQSQQDHPKIT